ncbi:MAG: hypothetical protein ABFS38_21480 [Bacteroidota bacterium]
MNRLTTVLRCAFFFRKRPLSKAVKAERDKSIEMLRQLSWLSGLDEKEFKLVAKRFRLQGFPLGVKLLKDQNSEWNTTMNGSAIRL